MQGHLNPVFNGGTLKVDGSGSYKEGVVFNEGGGTVDTQENANFAFTGTLSGSGAVTKKGKGILMLSGDNGDFKQTLNAQEGETQITGAYGGDVTVGDGAGVLLKTGSVGNIKNSGTVNFETSDALTYGGTIEGGGTIAKYGSGVVTVNGATGQNGVGVTAGQLILTHDLNGDADVQSGATLQVGTGGDGVEMIKGKIVNDGRVIVDTSGPTTLTGAMVGKGDFVKQGSGELVISGPVTAGLTSVQGGQLTVMTTVTSALRVSEAGTAQIGSGGTQGVIVGGIENDGNVVFGYTGDTMLMNPLSGKGDFIKQGGGEMRAFGDSDGTGNVIVQGGRFYMIGESDGMVMLVGAGAYGGGTGSIGEFRVSSGGTAAPGGSIGTLTVNGDALIEAGAAMEYETDADGRGDLLKVSGIMTIEGGQVHVLAGEGEYKPLTEYTAITAEGGVDGVFEGIDTDRDNLTAYLDYMANAVRVTLVRNDYRFSNSAVTANQYWTAEAVQALGYGNAVWHEAITADSAELPAMMNSLSGEIHASVPTGLIGTAQRVRYAVEDRMAKADGKHAWVRLINSTGRDKGTLEAGTGERVMDGILFGYDVNLGSSTMLGLAIGRSDTDYDVDARHSEAKMDTTHVMIYGGHRVGKLRASAAAGYDFAEVKTTRQVVAGSIHDTNRAEYDATLMQVMGEVSYDLDVKGVSVAPFLNIAAVDYRVDRFGEAGGDTALTGMSAKDTREYATLGMRASDTKAGPVSVNGLAGWQYAAGNDLKDTRGTRFSWTDTPHGINGVPTEQNMLRLEGEVSMAVGKRGKLGVSYGGLFGEKSTDQSVRLEFTLAL